MFDNGFIHNALIFRVKIKDSNETFPFFIRQTRKIDNDEFDGEIWGHYIDGRFTGKSAKDVFVAIRKKLDAKYLNAYTITEEK